MERLKLCVELDMSPVEYAMISDYADQTRQSIPDALLDLILTGVTLGLDTTRPAGASTGCLTLEPPAADHAPQR